MLFLCANRVANKLTENGWTNIGASDFQMQLNYEIDYFTPPAKLIPRYQ